MNTEDQDEKAGRPGVSPEQAADLAAIRASVAGEAVTDPAGEGGELAPAGPSADAMGAAALVVGIAQPILCATVKGLSEAPADLWGPVTESMAGLLDHYGLAAEISNPWARFGIACAPLAGFALMARMQEEKDKPKTDADTLAAPKLEAVAADQAPGAKTVQFGAVQA
jgi:hypothetical protein